MLGFKKLKHCPRCGSRRFDMVGAKSRRCGHCGFEMFENTAASVVALILNSEGQLLVARRKNDPARGTLDLPGGFCDAGETAEQAVKREVGEETQLNVLEAKYIFSLPNVYHYSSMDIPTLDLFFICKVDDFNGMQPKDDVAECFFMNLSDINPDDFGLQSIRKGIEQFIVMQQNT